MALTTKENIMARSTDDILRIIQGLLDKANDPAINDNERQALLDKADALMLKHSLEEWQLMAAMPKEERRKPITERFRAADADAPHWEKFRRVMGYIARLYRVRAAFHYFGDVTLVGYHEDVQYVKTKFLNVYLHFSKTIDPRWDTNLTAGQNAYNFKVSGTPWTEVEIIANRYGCPLNIKQLREEYRVYSTSIGEPPTRMTQSQRRYRESFATAFTARICARIEQLIEDRDKATAEAGALVAVKDLGLDVDEMFYNLFEHLRPMSPEDRAAQEEAWRAQQEREARELEERLAKMTPAQRRAYDEKQEREWRKAARANRAYWRQQDREFNAEGASLGRKSADSVDLDRRAETGAAATRREL